MKLISFELWRSFCSFLLQLTTVCRQSRRQFYCNRKRPRPRREPTLPVTVLCPWPLSGSFRLIAVRIAAARYDWPIPGPMLFGFIPPPVHCSRILPPSRGFSCSSRISASSAGSANGEARDGICQSRGSDGNSRTALQPRNKRRILGLFIWLVGYHSPCTACFRRRVFAALLRWHCPTKEKNWSCVANGRLDT